MNLNSVFSLFMLVSLNAAIRQYKSDFAAGKRRKKAKSNKPWISEAEGFNSHWESEFDRIIYG